MSDWKLECFKNVVIDLINNREDRPAGDHIPRTVAEEGSTHYFVETYQCPNPMQGRFIITRFVMYEGEKKIVVEYENLSVGMGGGAVVGYEYDGTDVTFAHTFSEFFG